MWEARASGASPTYRTCCWGASTTGRRCLQAIACLCGSRFDRPWFWNGIASFEESSNQTTPCLVEFCEGLFRRYSGAQRASNVSKLRVAGDIVDCAIVLKVSLNADFPGEPIIVLHVFHSVLSSCAP